MVRTANADPATLETLVKGMSGGTLPVAKALAVRFPCQDYKTFLDGETARIEGILKELGLA